MSDVIVAPSGKLIHGEFFTHLFYGSEGIRQFQVEQTSLSELTIRCVAVDESAFGSIRDRVTRLIHEHGDRDFSLTWERLDRIPPSKSGKYRFTISRVPASAAQRQVHALDK